MWGAVTLLRYPKLNITTDATGNLYVAGNIHLYTFNNYATVGCFQNDADYPHTDMNSSCFISKFNPSGQRIWSTYYALNNNLASTIVDDIM
ncbi:MAG: hypothetical protein H7239_09370 [Flavobacterium sp.]|nr:hypothetical protein [Flavobacterium sp.]